MPTSMIPAGVGVQNPSTLFDVTTAGATRAKAAWPNGYTVTLPAVGSGVPGIAAINDGANQVGSVFSPDKNWDSVLLDFAAVGAADLTLTVEIGRLNLTGTVPIVLASVALKSITTAGTVANINPFTGAVIAATTFRFFDLVTLTNYGNTLSDIVAVNGTENDQVSQLKLDANRAKYFYVVVTSLSTLTRALCALTPQQ